MTFINSVNFLGDVFIRLAEFGKNQLKGKNVLAIVSLLVTISLFFPFQTHAATVSKKAGKEGKQMVEKLLSTVEDLRDKLNADYSDENYQKLLKEAQKITLDLINFEELSSLVLGKNYQKMNVEQKEHFTSLFHQLLSSRSLGNAKPSEENLQKAIPFKIIDEHRESDKIFAKQAIVVDAEVWDDKIVYEIAIYLFRDKKNKNKLRIYDVHIDEASLLLDYRNQFSRIINENGMDHLIGLLEKKINSLKDKLNGKNE